MSEVITILIERHRRHYSTEKHPYMLTVGDIGSCFNKIPCHAQFIRAISKTMPYLDLVLEIFAQLNATRIQKFCIVDSTSLPVTGYNKKDVKWALNSAGKSKNMTAKKYGSILERILQTSFKRKKTD